MSGNETTLRHLTDQAKQDTVPEQEATPCEQPDVAVQWVAFALGEIQALLSWPVYTRRARRWEKSGRLALYFNYAYVAGWVVVFITLAFLSAAWPAFAAVAAFIASYRLLEIVVWYLKLLFDCNHRLMVSPERNLLFLTIDAAAVVFIVAFWLSSATSISSTLVSEVVGALHIFTLNGTPAGFSGWQSDVATLIGTLGGLFLIGAGLVLLVGLVSGRFSFGSAEDYTGPMRLPKPLTRPWDRFPRASRRAAPDRKSGTNR